jgi:GNAT superfamily N-acetyltransferase
VTTTGPPLHADRALGARLEGLAAETARSLVTLAVALEPSWGAASLEVAGGVATFLGPESPMNVAYGLGFEGSFTAEDAQALEGFFVRRNERPGASLSPLADPSVAEVLGRRGWVVDGFENVAICRLPVTEDRGGWDAGIEIGEVSSEEERDVWALAAAAGFSHPLPPLPAQVGLGRIVAARPGARLFLARVDGEVAGTGELHMADGVAWLSADATLPRFRGRGVQRALQCHRLALGSEAGCELAVSESLPGSASQRNMERLGFRVAYTRVDLVAPQG